MLLVTQRYQDLEKEARAIAAQYASICACAWGTYTKSGPNVPPGGRPLQWCVKCNKVAEFRLEKTTAASQKEHNEICDKRKSKSDRIWNKGEWERLDGKPFLKHTKNKLETQFEKRRRLAFHQPAHQQAAYPY